MPAPQLRLYHYWRSSSSWRVRWGLTIKGITPEYVPVSLLDGEAEAPEHRSRNPLGYVPVLEFLDAPADSSARFLTESLAILELLDETQPGPGLLPPKSGDPLARARARQLAEIINSGTQPIQNPTVFQMHSDDAAAQKRWAQFWIHNGLAAYEHWASKTAGLFSVGDQITLADLCLVPQIYNATRFDVTLERYPTVKRVYEAALSTPECQAAAPDRFKPAEA